MTHFLPAGFLRERVETLYRGILRLSDLLDEDVPPFLKSGAAERPALAAVQELVRELREEALEMKEILEGLPSEPVVYTGEGSTEEVIRLLEEALNRLERAR